MHHRDHLSTTCFNLKFPGSEKIAVLEKHEFGLVSGKVCHGSQQERGGSWFCAVDEVVLDRLEAHVCQSFEEGEKAMHSV